MNNYIKEALEEFDKEYKIGVCNAGQYSFNENVKAFLQSKLKNLIKKLWNKTPDEISFIRKPYMSTKDKILEARVSGHNEAVKSFRRILKEHKQHE